MTRQQRQLRTEWLAALGVPAPFHDTIIDAPNDTLTSGGGTALALAMVAITIGVMVGTFIWLDRYVQAGAAAVATRSTASLTHVDVGLGPLILLFGLIALMGWAASALAARHTVNGFLSSAAGMLSSPPKQGLTKWAMWWILSGSVRWASARSANVGDFLRDMVDHQTRRWGRAAILLLLPAVLLTVLESNSFWVAGPAGIVEHRMFPPFSSRRFALTVAAALTTGCNHTDKNERLIYEIRLASGEQFDLGDAEPFRGNKIAAIEEIDAKIDQEIEHVRWSHLHRDPVHPACLNGWARQFDRDGQRRLAKLLRLTTDEVRAWSAR